MSIQSPRLLVTGASGQLGRLVVAKLLESVPGGQIITLVRDAAAAESFKAQGVEARLADYDQPQTLDAALAGADRVLLISSNVLGRRVAQHRNVIAAAKRVGVGLVIYTSVLHADRSPLGLAEDHRQTEAALAASGLPHVILRNGWYTENYTAAIAATLAHHALIGGAGEGQISSAARADYAAAAAIALTTNEDWNGRVFELAGDTAHTLSQLAAEIARRSGQAVAYANLAEGDHKAALIGAGLPEEVAGLISDSDAAASKGALFDDGRELSALIGRQTTPMADTVAAALA